MFLQMSRLHFFFMVECMCIYTHAHTHVYVTVIYTHITQRTLTSLKELPVLFFLFFNIP